MREKGRLEELTSVVREDEQVGGTKREEELVERTDQKLVREESRWEEQT